LIGEYMVYLSRWVKEKYALIRLRKDLYEKIVSLKGDKSFSDFISDLLNNVNNAKTSEIDAEKIVEDVMSDAKEFIETNYESKNMKVFRFPGGDYYVFDDLNKFFMKSRSNVFVEVFGGSCFSALNVDRSKFKVIVCNDIDSLIINIFNMIKNSPEILMRKLAILPYSREIREISWILINDPRIDITTKTIMMFYLLRSSFFGIASKSGFAFSKTENMALTYTRSINAIKEYAKRSKDVLFENKDYKEILKLYDSENTLFYLDPPYVSLTETQDRESFYRYSFTLSELKVMAKMLNSVKGEFVLKVAKDNYDLIRNDLPDHESVELVKTRQLERVEEERDTWNLVIAHNIKQKIEKKEGSILRFMK